MWLILLKEWEILTRDNVFDAGSIIKGKGILTRDDVLDVGSIIKGMRILSRFTVPLIILPASKNNPLSGLPFL